MVRLLALVGSTFLILAAPPALSAQAQPDRVDGGPTIQAARAGITAPSAATPIAVGAQLETPSREAAALMIVGGAALLTGLVIGGDAGTVISVGGALLGLYGLWLYVR